MNLKDVEYESADLTRYLWAYTGGPAFGGLLAGVFYLYHKNAVGKIKATQGDGFFNE